MRLTHGVFTLCEQALISACEKGGRLDKALQVYEEMKAAGREADMITFSNLLTGKQLPEYAAPSLLHTVVSCHAESGLLKHKFIMLRSV